MRKKVLVRAAIFISVLLFIFQGILMYREYTSYQGVLHQQVDKVIKIRVDAIGESIFYNALKHPSYYYRNFTKDQDSHDQDSSSKGFGLPANIFLYTINGKNASTLFSSFKISDANQFEAYLRTENFSGFQELNTLQFASKDDGKLVVAYNNKQCVVVYNPTREDVNDIFRDMLLDDKTLNTTQTIYRTLKDADAHINYLSPTDHLSINFKDGKAVFSGSLALGAEYEVSSEMNYPKFSEESSLKFFMNLKTSKHFEAITIQDITIVPDSILKYYNGHMLLELAGTTIQHDSIVTYEYNDDFEKVEVKTVSVKEVPEINLMLSANSKNFLSYLQHASIVNDNYLNANIVPLYQFKVDTTANTIQLSTHLSKIIRSDQTSYNGVFGLEIDFEKLKSQNHFSMINDYLNKTKILNLKGTLVNKTSMAIEGELQLKAQDINAMAQLIF